MGILVTNVGKQWCRSCHEVSFVVDVLSPRAEGLLKLCRFPSIHFAKNAFVNLVNPSGVGVGF